MNFLRANWKWLAVVVALVVVFGYYGCRAHAQTSPGDKMWTAACDGDLATVKHYVEGGVPVDYQGPGGFTSLLCSARNGHLDVVTYLVSKGADINKRDNSRDKTPLLAAAFKYHLDVVTFLIDHHADVNLQGINGWTPLHDAGYVGKLDVVKEIDTHGADRTIKNTNGETAQQTTKRAYDMCKTKDVHCPITEGLTDATLADYEAVLAYFDQPQCSVCPPPTVPAPPKPATEPVIKNTVLTTTAGAHQLNLATETGDVDVTRKYFVGGVKEIPGDVVKMYYAKCAGKQTMKTCTWVSKLVGCEPTLMCNGTAFWTKSKGYNVAQKGYKKQ